MKQVLSFKKCYRRIYLVHQQGGQAVVEYVLLLIVSVSMLFLFKGVVKGIDEFMYSYMGEYISCLMEYGELPTQKSAATNLNQHSQGAAGKTCDSKFKGFTLTGGKSAVASSPSSNKSGNSADRGGSSSKGASQSADSKSSSNKDSAKSNSDNSSAGAGPGAKSPYANGSIQRSSNGSSFNTADNGASSVSQDKVRVIEQDESDESRRDRLGGSLKGSRTIYERSQYRAITGKQLEEVQSQNKTLRTPTSQVLSAADEGYRMGPRKSIFTPPETKAFVAEQQDDNQMDFGYFMKWLIIIAMGLAIFLFFGSQFMSFMNSQEK